MSDVEGSCCHGALGVHVTETSLLAACLVEHDMVTRILGHGIAVTEADRFDLIELHKGVDQALAVWRTAQQSITG